MNGFVIEATRKSVSSVAADGDVSASPADRDADGERGHVPGERGGLAGLQKPRIQHEFATLLADPASAVRVFLRGVLRDLG